MQFVTTVQRYVISHSSPTTLRYVCRLAQAPPTQPDGLYINSSKIPEAAKALDPGLDDATVTAWMSANGFQEVTALLSTAFKRRQT